MKGKGPERLPTNPHDLPKLKIEDISMEVGNIALDDIVGQEEAVHELKRMVNIIKYIDIYKSWGAAIPRGILLTGPPGTGKTASVRALGNALLGKAFIVELSYLDIASRWVDMPIERLRNFFEVVEQKAKTNHVIIFIDEIDSMIPERNDQMHETSRKRVNVFLEWMDGGFTELNNITIIGATNDIDGMDRAAKRSGRFSKIIEYKELDADSIIKGLRIYFGKKDFIKDFMDKIDWIAIRKEIKDGDLTGADLPEIVSRIVEEKAAAHVAALESKNYSNLSLEEKRKLIFDQDIVPNPINTNDIINVVRKFVKKSRKKDKNSLVGFMITAEN